MLICASDNASNIFAATPELFTIPAPTIDTFDMSLADLISRALIIPLFSSRSFNVASRSPSATVKLMSFVFPSPIDCNIRSTDIPAFAIISNTWNAFPGASSTPHSAILAQSLSLVTPLTSIFSTCDSSFTYVPSLLFKLERTDIFTLYFFAISTLLL